jgi:hypothetical protein
MWEREVPTVWRSQSVSWIFGDVGVYVSRTRASRLGEYEFVNHLGTVAYWLSMNERAPSSTGFLMNIKNG